MNNTSFLYYISWYVSAAVYFEDTQISLFCYPSFARLSLFSTVLYVIYMLPSGLSFFNLHVSFYYFQLHGMLGKIMQTDLGLCLYVLPT